MTREDKLAIYITEDQVRSLLTMEVAIEALEQAFMARANGDAFNVPRRRLPTSSGSYNFMSASWPSHNLVGHKSYAGGRAGIQFHVMLYDTSHNKLLAVIEANRMGQVRTGAASGVATKYMAGERRGMTVGIIGSGYQAETQLEALTKVRDVLGAKVFSRDAGNRESFARRMSAKLEVAVTPVDAAEEAASADIVCTITSSSKPVLLGDWLQAGTHVNAAGNNSWMKRELDTKAVVAAEIMAVDDVEQAKIECGELMSAAESGRFSWDAAVPIDEVVSGQRSGRLTESGITIFESQGIALEDIAVCERIVQLAHQGGTGMELC